VAVRRAPDAALPGRPEQGDRVAEAGLAFAPDGRSLALGSYGPLVRVWDPEAGEDRVCQGYGLLSTAVAYSPDGRSLAATAGDPFAFTHAGGVRVWDVTRGEPRWGRPQGQGGFLSLAWSPDGGALAGRCPRQPPGCEPSPIVLVAPAPPGR
jgi:WD40 repeat protein